MCFWPNKWLGTRLAPSTHNSIDYASPAWLFFSNKFHHYKAYIHPSNIKNVSERKICILNLFFTGWLGLLLELSRLNDLKIQEWYSSVLALWHYCNFACLHLLVVSMVIFLPMTIWWNMKRNQLLEYAVEEKWGRYCYCVKPL